MGVLYEALLAEEASQYGAGGGRAQVVWSNGILASTAVGLFIQLVAPWHTQQVLPILLEYDGNTHAVNSSRKERILRRMKCTHYTADLGDPFFTLTSQGDLNGDQNYVYDKSA